MRIAMSPPDFFSVDYVINPWMDPTVWHHDAAQLAHDARVGWERLRATYERLGATIDIEPPVDGLPDLVFTANAAVVLNGVVLLARYRFPERQGEEAHNRVFFEGLRSQGVIETIVTLPDGILFEGAGDAIWDPTRQLFWTGHGQRSTPDAAAFITSTFGQETRALRLVDPRFYHLDTCLCVLPGGEALHYPAAFDNAGLALLRSSFGDRLITVDEADALTLSANAFPVTAHDIVFGRCGADLEALLSGRGYRVHRADLGSFALSGGSAFCLTLRLDGRSKSASD
jgi:N-dimethylarginine dimethylaminohydrolase